MTTITIITNKMTAPEGYKTAISLIRLGGMIGYVFWNPIVEIEGPFAEDFTKLKWRYRDHRDGETAEFWVCGLRTFVQDCDGDDSIWDVRKGRNGSILADGRERDFYSALAAAEAALRQIISERIVELRRHLPSVSAGDNLKEIYL